MRIHITAGALTLAFLVLAEPAGAVDGVIEINQASALAGSLDGEAGFPVRIQQPGSYRLTSDLAVGPLLDGFFVESSDVTLDLNGFRLHGAGDTPTGRFGIWIQQDLQNVEIRNGTIANFPNGGVFVNAGGRDHRLIGLRVTRNSGDGLLIQSEGSLIRDCTVTDNGHIGINTRAGSLVIGNVVVNNADYGLFLRDVGWGSNVVAQNNGGNANPQVSLVGGAQIATNLCGTNTTCP